MRPYVTTCNTEQVLEALVAHQVSVGFIEGPTLRRDVRTEVFLEDEIVLMVPPAHEWSERGFVDPEELKQERLLMRERGSGTRRVVEMALQKRGVKVKHLNLGMEFDSTEGITTAVEAGLGNRICLALGDQQRVAGWFAASRADSRSPDQTAAQCGVSPWPGTPGDCPRILQFPAISPRRDKSTTIKAPIPRSIVRGLIFLHASDNLPAVGKPARHWLRARDKPGA